MPAGTPLAEAVMARLDAVLPAAADPVRAVGARAYMRDQFPFLGVASPALAQLTRAALAGTAKPAEADLVAIALACWERPEREYQYVACA